MTAVILRRATDTSGRMVDLGIEGGRFVDPASIDGPREEIDLEGRAVLPGLADHHIHLFALAAAARSVDLSPAALALVGGLGPALRAARADSPDGWLRGIGYDVRTSGRLDRWTLDDIGDVGPVRVQDRTGIQWVLDSRALALVLPDVRDAPPGVEIVDGTPTGVLVRLDHWLGHRVPAEPVDLTAVGRRLSSLGITAVTDAGADNSEADLRALGAARLPFRVAAMTREAEIDPVEGVELGPVKVLLDDTDLPPLDELAERVRAARTAGRAVAVHCVTPVQVVLALAAGIGVADRIEHASLVPHELLGPLAAAGPTLVVQPGLVATRGDRYLRDVEPRDLDGLHRLASFRRAGLRIAASSDAPYGPSDPWTAIRAAVDRRTDAGVVVGPGEALGRSEAVALLAGDLHDPGTPRTLDRGRPADLVVLDEEWGSGSTFPLRPLATVVEGRIVAGSLGGLRAGDR